MCTLLLCRRGAFNWFREVWRGLEDTGRNERAMDKWWRWRRGGGEGELSREAVVCVLYEGMEGVNPFLHHYLVSASALTLISLRAARLARTLPHHSIHPSTPFKTLRHHPSSRLIPFTSMSFFLCSLSISSSDFHTSSVSRALCFIFVSVEIDWNTKPLTPQYQQLCIYTHMQHKELNVGKYRRHTRTHVHARARTHTETYVAAPGLAAINTEDCKEEETRLKS